MSVYRVRWLFILLVGIGLGLLAAAQPAAAQTGGPSFTVRPARYDPNRPATMAYFVYDVEAGRRFHDEVRVINTGDQPGVVRLYAVDAATGQNSGAVYLDANAPRRSVGGWVTLDTPEITLGPGEEQLVGFSVAVPEGARTGEHLGGVVAEGVAVTSQPTGSSFAVNLQVRSVVALQVNLPGPRVDQLAVTGLRTEVRSGQQVLVVSLHNQGTHMVKSAGVITVFDSADRQIAQVPVQIDHILPGDTLDLAVLVPVQALPAGDYRAELQLTAGKQRQLIRFATPLTVTVAQVEQMYGAQPQQLPPLAPSAGWAIPWPSLILGAISAALFALYLARRLRPRYAARTP